ncbi:MAG TPA: PQQ-dependent sugar dehydrogenase [Cyclobacteriaceae bacterium]
MQKHLNLRNLLLIAAINVTITACSSNNLAKQPLGNYKIVEAFPKLLFARPVDFQHAGDGSNRIFVVEQAGLISVFSNDEITEVKNVFLDISNLVDDGGNEEGLLGLAFHPNYAANGFFYVNYTASNPNRTVISRFSVSANANLADPASEMVILEFTQPFSNHNGGQISFGPDGYLYIATGDGGSGGDPQGNGQNLSTLLGKILRIDVNNQSGINAYSIPQDNPFANNSSGFREEIYAYGLRNTWRFSFDPVTGWIWAGDVGQNAYEEIDIIEKGGNYGWNIMEGNHCYEPPSNCNETGLKGPVWEYGRSEGISVTGGFVYRGSDFLEFMNSYIYADYGSGKIWALDFSDLNNPVNSVLIASALNISSFGIDQNHELYLCAFDGKIYKLAGE